ncbi:MAG TPA: glycosyltransferase family 4 protein [Pyrinomonadaceae bacterium]|nr:glycosyltransferase family 4 protein [Pyrinomonadaceae bacterium]
MSALRKVEAIEVKDAAHARGAAGAALTAHAGAQAARVEPEAEAARLPVVFVVTQSGSRANGGVESITQVLENLRGVRALVVTQAETRFNRRWREAGARVLVWPMPSLGLVSLLKNNLRTFRLLRSEGCRVVHCNDIYALWQTAFGARAAGARVVFNVRNVKPAGKAYGWRWRLARRLSARQLVLSKEMGESLARRLGVKDSGAVTEESRAGVGESGAGVEQSNAARIEFIYSVVDTRRFRPAGASERAALRERLGVGADCFAVGVVAAFDPRKAQLDFVERAAPLLKRLAPRARVYFVGDFEPARDEYARRCADATQRAGLGDAVSFVGYTEDVAGWYRALDVVVVASRNEGLARCMIESLACGTPVVSFDVCSAREILEGRGCGVVVRSGDYEALAGALASLASDGEGRARFGACGVAAARELFDPQQVAQKYERLYLSLAGG